MFSVPVGFAGRVIDILPVLVVGLVLSHFICVIVSLCFCADAVVIVRPGVCCFWCVCCGRSCSDPGWSVRVGVFVFVVVVVVVPVVVGVCVVDVIVVFVFVVVFVLYWFCYCCCCRCRHVGWLFGSWCCRCCP